MVCRVSVANPEFAGFSITEQPSGPLCAQVVLERRVMPPAVRNGRFLGQELRAGSGCGIDHEKVANFLPRGSQPIGKGLSDTLYGPADSAKRSFARLPPK